MLIRHHISAPDRLRPPVEQGASAGGRVRQRDADFQWIHNGWRVARSQGFECGLVDLLPTRYPVLCGPILDLRGHGMGRRVLYDDLELAEHCVDGYFWMAHVGGERIYTDAAVVAGEIAWCRHTVEVPGDAAFAGYWVVQERTRPRLERYCAEWMRAHLAGYTGMLNLESIAGRIVGAGLRVSDRWPDLYGRKWSDAVVRLHERGTWDLVEGACAEGYSLDLFGRSGYWQKCPDAKLMAHAATVGISSIHVCCDGGLAEPSGAAGEVRLAVINCFNLQVGLRVRRELARDLQMPAAAHLGRTTAASLPASSLSSRL